MSRQSFMIEISENQRRLIEAALGFAFAMGAFEGNDLDEVAMLHTLTKDLPADDAACEPDTLHGFCL